MKWSTWYAKGGKRDDVDALSYTLASGKGSSGARRSFHCFKESEKILNETLMWSTDCSGTSGADVETVDKGPKVIRVVWTEQKALKHTNICMGIDRNRGSRVGAEEARKPRWLSNRGQESCV